MDETLWPKVRASLREFTEFGNEFLRHTEGEQLLREELTGGFSSAALMLLLERSPEFRSRFLVEILKAIERGPTSHLLLARDVLRSLPRGVLEGRVHEALPSLLATGDDQDYARLSEIIVELRLVG